MFILVIASASEAMDCFVACAPRNDEFGHEDTGLPDVNASAMIEL
jgi:hypothetical protein